MSGTRMSAVLLVGLAAAAASAVAQEPKMEFRRLSVAEYRDKMKAGWIGQMGGVSFGAPTEFKWKGAIIPEDKTPKWKADLVNGAFGQDDLYVEMTFLRTLEQYGFDVSIRQAGIDWANSRYGLWHANDAGRGNLRKGIAPPDSGHPQFNKHADDIDYQIEADYSGLVAPGLPNVSIQLGEKFGRLMNYGDGLYGGQFIGATYAEAFFQTDPVKIAEAGLKCIPEKSQYAECIRDVLKWYRDYPEDWQKTWALVEEKYQKNKEYRKFSCGKGDYNIDAKINGAYVVMGLLYGQRDPEKTMAIACRCGQDSDCNPSSPAGVVFTTYGFSKLPDAFRVEPDHKRVFQYTEYNFPRLLEATEKVAREVVVKAGGRIEKDDKGEEVFVIPVQTPKPGKLEQCWEPGPIANSKFTEEEMAKITVKQPAKGGGGQAVDIKAVVEKFAPGWSVKDCGPDMDPGLRAEFGGRKNVLMTHPLNRDTGCVLSRKVDVPEGKKTTLHVVVGHDPGGDFDLIVRADGKELLKKTVGKDTAKDGWLETDVDLSASAGKTINLELVNQPTAWTFEAAYWAEIKVKSE